MQTLEQSFLEIIKSTGEDIKSPALQDTSARAAKAFMYYTRGYRQDISEIINDALFDTDSQDMVIVKDIEFYSLCEHHLAPIIGKCHIAYIPNNKVLGLSKCARVVDYFACRLQIQEKLTHQIASFILETTQAKGVGVFTDAKHLCMTMRGIEKQHTYTSCSSILGCFETDQNLRRELISSVQYKASLF